MTIFSSKIGRYRHRITFQEQAQHQDPITGAISFEWIDVQGLVNVPAEVLTGAGSEVIVDSGKKSSIKARINTRYFDGIQSHWRILHNEDVYNIESFDYDASLRREIRLQCTSGISDGS